VSDLSPPEHTATAAIDEAAAWLSKHPRDRIHRPIVPHLKQAFGLSTADAIEAIREANLRGARAA
jgi:hypothetical protein